MPYKSPLNLVENEYKNLSDEAIDLFGKGQRLSPEKQQRYDQIKKEMSAQANKNFNVDPEAEQVIDNANKQDTQLLLKQFGYTDEQISKLTDEDLDIARDFFARFNNPKPRR